MSPVSRLQADLRCSGQNAALLTVGANFRFLTGLDLHATERFTACLIPARGAPLLVVPALDAEAARSGHIPDVLTWADGSDPYIVLAAAAQQRGVAAGPWAVEKRVLRLAEAEAIARALPGMSWSDAASLLEPLRVCKAPAEVAVLQRAADLLLPVLAGLPKLIRPGIREIEIAHWIRNELERAGAAGLSFPTIALTGTRSALPHGHPGDATVQAGDVVLCDFGAEFGGYCSDITRVYAVSRWEPSLARIFDVVRQANLAAVAAIRPGAVPAAVDEAARQVIAAAGYGEFFIHRTGHGLGLEIHEPPWIAAGSTEPLAEGMVFTVEPGIYVPGLGGVRLEDMVVVTATGCHLLTDGRIGREQALIVA